MRLRKPSKYQGRIRASSFDRIARRQVSSYPSHATPEILLAIREYLVNPRLRPVIEEQGKPFDLG